MFSGYGAAFFLHKHSVNEGSVPAGLRGPGLNREPRNLESDAMPTRPRLHIRAVGYRLRAGCQEAPRLDILIEIALKSDYLLALPAGSGTCHFERNRFEKGGPFGLASEVRDLSFWRNRREK